MPQRWQLVLGSFIHVQYPQGPCGYFPWAKKEKKKREKRRETTSPSAMHVLLVCLSRRKKITLSYLEHYGFCFIIHNGLSIYGLIYLFVKSRPNLGIALELFYYLLPGRIKRFDGAENG
jgi:hypothetical protein